MMETLEIITVSNADSIRELGHINLREDATGEFASSESRLHIAITTKSGIDIYGFTQNYALQKIASQNNMEEIIKVRYHPLKNVIVAAGVTENLYIWNIDSNKLDTLVAHTSPIGGLGEISEKGLVASTGSWDRIARVWNVETNAPITTLFDVTESNCLSISSNALNDIIAIGDVNGEIAMWNLKGDLIIRESKAHPAGIIDISFSSDGMLMASADISETIKLWDVKTWHEIAEFNHPYGIRSLSFGKHSSLVASSGISDGSIQLWDIYNNCSVRQLSCDGAGSLVNHFFMGGRLLLSLSADGILQIWGIPQDSTT
jgi:WD40 repeat protein